MSNEQKLFNMEMEIKKGKVFPVLNKLRMMP
jgi:hypothetical protein